MRFCYSIAPKARRGLEVVPRDYYEHEEFSRLAHLLCRLRLTDTGNSSTLITITSFTITAISAQRSITSTHILEQNRIDQQYGCLREGKLDLSSAADIATKLMHCVSLDRGDRE